MSELLSTYLSTSPILACIIAFIGGILSSLTPCIYPMIPIIIGIISQSKAPYFFSSLIYVLGIAITYSTLGVISAIGGRFFGAPSPLIYFIMGNICIILALSMLNLFSFPSFSFKIRVGGFIGIFFLGLVSGFACSPCVTPILGALLSYIAMKKDIIFGALLLFSFSLGLGFLLILIGTFGGRLFKPPNPGPWMEKIKKILAFILIGVGEYFIFIAGKQ